MARYTGPKTRLSRAVGQSLFGYDKSFERRKYAPGQHGPAKRRKQKSEYGTQLLEKQKAKYTYGLLERQFRKTFEDATRRHGVTGEWLLQLLEARLDNVVYRLGLSPSRPGARQLVNHRHICLNGKIVNIPSCQVRPGDRVSVRGRSQNFDVIVGAASRKENRGKFGWLEWNGDKMEGAFLSYPTRDQIPEAINEQLIVELYSK